MASILSDLLESGHSSPHRSSGLHCGVGPGQPGHGVEGPQRSAQVCTGSTLFLPRPGHPLQVAESTLLHVDQATACYAARSPQQTRPPGGLMLPHESQQGQTPAHRSVQQRSDCQDTPHSPRRLPHPAALVLPHCSCTQEDPGQPPVPCVWEDPGPARPVQGGPARVKVCSHKSPPRLHVGRPDSSTQHFFTQRETCSRRQPTPGAKNGETQLRM